MRSVTIPSASFRCPAGPLPASNAAARRTWHWVALLLALVLCTHTPAQALHGDIGAHDPSTIIKEGNKYWVFTTGEGIPSKYSTDLVKWTASPRPVFTVATRPGWIRPRVPQFDNTYWAPECVFMNGKYYLYYSCSTFGSKVSGIGLATNVTLDPASPNYNWVDEGEVISSNNNSASNAIDPSVYPDASGRLWFIYGSFFGGIRVLELSPATGKPLNGTATPQVAVANGDVEAAYVKQHGSFYYLFINRGACCRGVNSTYYIQVGRSTSPTGPFLDKNGVNLNSNGGSLLLNVSGRYTGPGHAGILEENGVNYFSHHYYDYEDNGREKLGVANLTWEATGWPVVSRDWLPSGRYEIANRNSGLLWQAGCTGSTGAGITQGNRNGQACQQWNFTAVGDGEYKITNAQGGQTAGTTSCSSANGATLQVGIASNLSCQLFRLERTNTGALVFASVNGDRVVEVPAASTVPNTPLALFDMNGCTCQQWVVAAPVSGTATTAAQALAGVSIYPVPASRQGFQIDLSPDLLGKATHVAVYDVRGQVRYRQVFNTPRATLKIEAALQPGIYMVQVSQDGGSSVKKVTVL